MATDVVEDAFWHERDTTITDALFDEPAATDLVAKYLPCKLRGHTFSQPAHDRCPDVVCQRCGTQRLQEFDDGGCVTKRTYCFPPGYNPEPG